MRSFSENEKSLIWHLVRARSKQGATIEDVLQSYYFKEAHGRGLIVHNHASYAVFFLKKSLFDDGAAKEKEVGAFFELLALLRYLSAKGYISIYKFQTDEFCFIQDGFDGHKRVGDEIVLNSKGYCSPNIETIIDGDKNVVYKGIVFRGENFNLISGMVSGNIYVSDRLESLGGGGDSAREMPAAALPVRSEIDATPQSAIRSPAQNGINESGATRKKRGKFDAARLKFVMSYLMIALLISSALFLIVDSRIKIDSLKGKIASLESKGGNAVGKIGEASTPALEKQVSRPKLYGIDISKWNGNVLSDLQHVENLSFAIIRATLGEHGTDNRFAENWGAAINKGLMVGAYHVFKVDEDPFGQAEHFIDIMQDVGKIDLIPIVDIEEGSFPKGGASSALQVQSALYSFLVHLEKKTNKRPMIYTNLGFANQYLLNTNFANYPLWLAEYSSADAPTLPQAWKETGFRIWQKQDSYSIASRDVDLDVFYGSRQDLIGME